MNWVDDSIRWLNCNSGAVSGLATIALCVISAIYVVITGKLARSSRRSADAANAANVVAQTTLANQVDQQEREQASLFAAWIHGRLPASDAAGFHYEVRYLNNSSMPVFNIDLELHSPTRETVPHTVDNAEPGIGSQVVIITVSHTDALNGQPEPAAVRVAFTDSHGRRWLREVDGILVRAQPAPIAGS